MSIFKHFQIRSAFFVSISKTAEKKKKNRREKKNWKIFVPSCGNLLVNRDSGFS